MSTDSYQSTTQVFLDIYDITNDLLLMKDGTASIIVTVDAMNFGLLAEEEQDAVMYAYAGLLNSLNYPIQIVIRSQTKDVTSYLGKLKEQEDAAPTRQNQDRIKRYREFVGNLIRERNVLDKKFYVVIPATSIELGILPASKVVPGQQQFDMSSIEKSVILEKARTILEPKRDHIIGQFGRIGLYSRQLTTQEIIQLFYLSYNPEAAEGQQLTDTRNYTTPLVSASVDAAATQSLNSVNLATPQAVPQNNAETPQTVQTIVTPTEQSVPETAVAAVAVTEQAPASEPIAPPLTNQLPEQTVVEPTPTSIQETVVGQNTDVFISAPKPSEPTLPEVQSSFTEQAASTEISSPPPSPVITPVEKPTPVTTSNSTQPKHFFIPPVNTQKPVQETIFSAPTTTPEPVTLSNVTTIEPVTEPPSTSVSPSPQDLNESTIESTGAQTTPTTSSSEQQPVSDAIKVNNGPPSQETIDAAQAELDKLANTVSDPAPDEPLPPLPEIT